MRYNRISPPKSISWLVRFFWEFEGDFSSLNPYKQTISASVCPKLAFQYEGGMFLSENGNEIQLFKSGFQSQSNLYSQISAHQKIGVFGAYFHPYALSIIFNLPASNFTNKNIEISELLGNEGRILEEQVLAATNTQQRVRIISRYIEHRLRRSSLEDINLIAAVQSIVMQRGAVNIPNLSDSLFLSQRHLERKFKNLTGFNPKTFARIVRFEECISKAISQCTSLTELTYELGYYDQSHMIKDFKGFSGYSPQNLLREDLSIFFD
ncbi:helix-turn-helix domain-containing protein [Echinicola salinicaeni]|uniref:helix-turn-helix domain-containing protein n=1 Tax=Echinicola salinicaeni TaxID=2762757 RepID=UPI0016472728|nr:helix-turn-helix domain-containing protein [Echinicola salinicaeni]